MEWSRRSVGPASRASKAGKLKPRRRLAATAEAEQDTSRPCAAPGGEWPRALPRNARAGRTLRKISRRRRVLDGRRDSERTPLAPRSLRALRDQCRGGDVRPAAVPAVLRATEVLRRRGGDGGGVCYATLEELAERRTRAFDRGSRRDGAPLGGRRGRRAEDSASTAFADRWDELVSGDRGCGW